MSKPLIETVRWAVDGSDLDAVNVTAPSSGNRDTGHVFGAVPSSAVDNYWQNKAYRWFQYLNNGVFDGDITISGSLTTTKSVTVGAQLLSFTDFTFTADSTADRLTHTAHGLLTGDGPVRVSNSGGGLPSGMVAATDYYAILVDADHIQLAATRADALAGFALDFLTNGTGTQTLLHQSGTTRVSDATVSRNATVGGALSAGSASIGGASFSFASAVFTANSVTDELAIDGHGLQTGSGPMRVSNSGGGLPSGLAAVTDYWVIRVNSGKFKLATSFVRAMASTAIDLTTTGTGTNSIVSGTSPTVAGNVLVHGNITLDGQVLQTGDRWLRFAGSAFKGESTVSFDADQANQGSGWNMIAAGSGAVTMNLWMLQPGTVVKTIVFWADKNGDATANAFKLFKYRITGGSGVSLATITDTSSGVGRIPITINPNYTVESDYFPEVQVLMQSTSSTVTFYGAEVLVNG